MNTNEPTTPNDAPTPETSEAAFGTDRVSVDFARRLERERDEARRALKHAEAMVVVYKLQDANLTTQAAARTATLDEMYARLDEAREEIDALKGDIKAMAVNNNEWLRKAMEFEDKFNAAQVELDRRHKEYATALNRRVDVENALAMVAAGKRDLLTREECRELAVKLGVSPATPTTKQP